MPDLGKANSARCWAGRLLRKCASRRWRTGIVRSPVHNLARTRVLANVFRGHDVSLVARGHAGTINSRTESGADNAIYPGVDVALLLREHAPALLLIQKDQSASSKALSSSCPRRLRGVSCPYSFGISDALQCGIKPPVKQDEETKSRGLNRCAMTSPTVRRFSRRIIQPISTVRKSLPQSFEIGVAGILIAIKTEIGSRPALRLSQRGAQEKNRGDRKTASEHTPILP